MRFHLGLRRQGEAPDLGGDVPLHMFMVQSPFQRGVDAPADAARGLGAGSPDRIQHSQHVALGDAVQSCISEFREDVAFKRLPPGLGVLSVAPGRLVRFVGALGGFAKGRNAVPALLGQGVAPLGDCGTVLGGELAGDGKRQDGEWPEADIPAAAVYGDSEHPGAATAGTDVQVQAAAVAVASRLELWRLTLGVGKAGHAPSLGPTFGPSRTVGL